MFGGGGEQEIQNFVFSLPSTMSSWLLLPSPPKLLPFFTLLPSLLELLHTVPTSPTYCTYPAPYPPPPRCAIIISHWFATSIHCLTQPCKGNGEDLNFLHRSCHLELKMAEWGLLKSMQFWMCKVVYTVGSCCNNFINAVQCSRQRQVLRSKAPEKEIIANDLYTALPPSLFRS